MAHAGALWWLDCPTGDARLCRVQATDCSFLYFNLEIVDAALSEACARPEEAGKLPYLVAAFSDAHSLLGASSDSPDPSHEVKLWLMPNMCITCRYHNCGQELAETDMSICLLSASAQHHLQRRKPTLVSPGLLGPVYASSHCLMGPVHAILPG